MTDTTEPKCILIVGDLSSGFTFYGPYDSFDEATEIADKYFWMHLTWVSTLDEVKVKNA